MQINHEPIGKKTNANTPVQILAQFQGEYEIATPREDAGAGEKRQWSIMREDSKKKGPDEGSREKNEQEAKQATGGLG